MNNNNNLDELLRFFETDKELLSFINSEASLTMTDEDEIFESPSPLYIENERKVTFWDTSTVTAICYKFYENKEFNQLLLWNTSNVEVMNNMFEGATSYNQPLYFITTNVVDTSEMFKGATEMEYKLKGISIG